MIALLLLPVVVATGSDVFYNARDGRQYFKEFVLDHHKVYKTNEEKALRYEIFLKNLDEINNLNRKHEHTKYGINQFTDLTQDEFLTQYVGSNYNLNSEKIKRFSQELTENAQSVEIPSEFDWRTKNVVPKVKAQGTCSAGWAFSATDNIQSLYAIKTGQMVELSAQQVIDCETLSGGCEGGYTMLALRHLSRLGAMSEESYPYESKGSICRYKHRDVIVNVTNYLFIRPNEMLIAEKLYQIGPLAVVLDATNLQFYAGGIITGDGCSHSHLNHVVLLVGYGVENKVPYWLAKNSWGESWGEKGYFKASRGMHCLNIGGYGADSAVLG